MAKNKLCGWGFCVTSLESVKIELTQNAQLRRTEFDENMQPFNNKSRHKFPPSSNPPLFPNILPTPHLPQLQDIARFPRTSPLTFLLQETKIPTARITITSTITPPITLPATISLCFCCGTYDPASTPSLLLQYVSRSTSPFAVAAELAIDLVKATPAEREVEYNVCVSWSVNPPGLSSLDCDTRDPGSVSDIRVVS
jgi:hypothetical protein